MNILMAIKNLKGYLTTMRVIAVVVLIDGSYFLMSVYEYVINLIRGLI